MVWLTAEVLRVFMESENQFDRRSVFIKGKSVMLKVLTEADVENSGWYGWFNDQAVTNYLQHGRFPNTMEKQREFLRSEVANRTSNKVQLGVLPIGDTKIVGVISLNKIDWINRLAEIALVIGERRQQGLGFEAMALLMRHAFLRLNLNRIWAGQHVDLDKWRETLICHLGFQEEGRLRQALFWQGKFVDAVLIGCLREDFLSLLDNKESRIFRTLVESTSSPDGGLAI